MFETDQELYDRNRDLPGIYGWADSEVHWLHKCDRCCIRFFVQRFYEVFPEPGAPPGFWYECAWCFCISMSNMVEEAARDGRFPRGHYYPSSIGVNELLDREVRTGTNRPNPPRNITKSR